MCEFYTCACIGCCCCLVVTVLCGLLWLGTAIGLPYSVVLKCVKDNITASCSGFDAKYPSYTETCDDDAGKRCWDDDGKPTKQNDEDGVCHTCACDQVTYISSLGQGTMLRRLGPCCDEFHGLLKDTFGEEFAAGAAKDCHNTLSELATNVTTLADCCKKYRFPQIADCDFPVQPNFCDQDDAANLVVSQLEMVHRAHTSHAWQHAGAVTSSNAALFGSAALVGAIAMTFVVRLRRGHNPVPVLSYAPAVRTEYSSSNRLDIPLL